MLLSKSLKKLMLCGVALMTVSSIGASFQLPIHANTQPSTTKQAPKTNGVKQGKKITISKKNNPQQALHVLVIPNSINGDLIYLVNNKVITNQNEINYIRKAAHISETNIFQQTAKQRKLYFWKARLAYYDYFAPFKPALNQKFIQPLQPGNMTPTMSISHSRKYGTSMIFEPSGVTVNQNGHAYVDGQYIGILNTDNFLNQHLEYYRIRNNSTVNSMVFKSGKYSSAVRLGAIKGRDITVIVPRHLQQKYDILVGRHVRHQMASMYRKKGQSDNADIMMYGHNYQGFGARIRYWLKFYINQAREQRHLQPLHYDARLQAITNLRVIQATNMYNSESRYLRMLQQNFADSEIDGWIHGRDLGQSASNDAELFNLTVFNNSGDEGENAGQSWFGQANERDLTYTNVETNDTPRELAYHTVYNMINHDNASHGGHAQNMLRSSATEAGFAVKVFKSNGKLKCTYLYDIN